MITERTSLIPANDDPGVRGPRTGSVSGNARKMAILTILFAITIVVIFGLPMVVSSITRQDVAMKIVYAYAAFEILSGTMFVVQPEALHNGWNPSGTGEDSSNYLSDSGGIAYFFWGLLLFLRANDDTTVLFLNGAWCSTYVVYLFGHLFDSMPYRSAVPIDGSFAMTPIVAKIIGGIASFVAATELVHKGG